MHKPIVAIVGRPNVGKSTLFNAIVGERISIVHDTPGITRDRIYAEANWLGHDFSLIDTGGIEPRDENDMFSAMREQANLAVEAADVIIFITDLKSGLLPQDQEISVMLRKADKPVILAVNKVDHPGDMPAEIYDFYQLGLDDLVAISAEHRLGLNNLLERVVSFFPEPDLTAEEDYKIAVAVIGKPNVGKSSLVNYLVGENRTIVSDVAGTTRDALDINIIFNNQKYCLIDTAGLRRRGKIKDHIEKFSVLRTLAAVERSSVCLIMIDALEGITEQDTKVAGLAHNAGKASIFVINKWDIIENRAAQRKQLMQEIARKFAFMNYAPVVFISAKTGLRMNNLFEQINFVYQEAGKRLTTGVINDVLAEAIAMNQPPQDKGRSLKIYYATQVSTNPPTLIMFVNDKKLTHFSYDRYLINQFRQNFGFEGSPLHIIWRNRKSNEII